MKVSPQGRLKVTLQKAVNSNTRTNRANSFKGAGDHAEEDGYVYPVHPLEAAAK